jgi:hypothetical protein
MKRLFALVFVVLFAALPGGQAQRLDDEYVQIFNLIQEADAQSSAQPSQALPKYLEAQKGLERLQKATPDWNPKVVAFRLSYVNSKIAALSAQAPAPGAVSSNAPAPLTAADLQLQLDAAKEQLRQIQGDKAVLEAKLKESLALQPAEADPRELARAQEKIKALQKENELLKVTVENEKAKLVESSTVKASVPPQQSLAEANRQLAQEKEANSRLALEKQALELRLKQLSTIAPASTVNPSAAPDESSRLKQLERERDSLQKQLLQANKELDARKAKPRAKQVKDLEDQLTDLRGRLEAFEAKKVPYSAEELALRRW